MNKIMYGLIALVLLGLMTGSVLAFGGMGRAVDARKSSLGLERQTMAKSGFNQQFQQLRPQHMKEMDDVLQPGNYEAWKELVSERQSPIAKSINEGNFDRFVEFHKARQANDLTTVQEISEELGIRQGLATARGSISQIEG